MVVGSLWMAGCGAGGLGEGHSPASAPSDPTPLAKCQISKNQESPLVTEWPASEKARFESLLSTQAVAVAYSGCELSIVETCRVPGSYAWRRTTLSTDTVEISDADELYAKLPLGALGLEGELQRAGRLAVRTTVGGQRRLDALPSLPDDEGCRSVTHVVTAVSIGAFRLMSGGSLSAGGGVGVGDMGASVKRQSQESVVRQAGDADSCAENSDEAPVRDCASPIQIFLAPVNQRSLSERQVIDVAERRARERGVLIAIPAPDDSDERWSLHDADGRTLCQLPCERWVAPRSGYYLDRRKTRDVRAARIDVPNEIDHEPGARVSAEYEVGRGSPFWSSLTFYGLGIPAAIGGTATLILALTTTSDDDDRNASAKRGFFIGATGMYYGIAAASTWWFIYSRPDSFDTYAGEGADSASVSRAPALRVRWLPPGAIHGEF